jgi:UDP-glucose 4-epimerase
MSEWMLRDAASAHGIAYAVLRYFNVAGADPQGRAGQSTLNATHLIKVACEAALGKRDRVEIFGSDYPTPDGTCVRDYIHVSDLVAAHLDALRHLRGGGRNLVLNCGYGRGYSVLEVINMVKHLSGKDFPVTLRERRPGDPAVIVARADKIRTLLGWQPKFDDLSKIVAHALAWERKLDLHSKTCFEHGVRASGSTH